MLYRQSELAFFSTNRQGCHQYLVLLRMDVSYRLTCIALAFDQSVGTLLMRFDVC
jgi:hypothetical protein